MEEFIKLTTEELDQRIDELGAAFTKRCNIDPRKCVLICQFDSMKGRYVYFYEKKRGRTRKDILKNLVH